MYSVYKITNLTNQKCYIGSSICPVRRWKQHINSSFNENSNSYNYPLQRAIRKYGIENFSFEILSTDFINNYDMEEYEKAMILKFNSLEQGYNQTLETHCPLRDKETLQKHIQKVSQKCAKVNKNEEIIEVYSSYQEAARKNGYINSASGIQKVCKGVLSSYNGEYFRDLDENDLVVHIPFKNYKNSIPIIGIPLDKPEDEIFFESILSASKILHLNRESIGKCIKGDKRYTNVGGYIWRSLDQDGNMNINEIDIDNLLEEYNRTHPLINGERHSIKEWCKIYNISEASFYKRINKEKMTVEQAITTPKRR